MKKKELKKLAQRIANCELIISDENSSNAQVAKAKDEIMSISGSLTPLDMMVVDEIVQDILNENI